MNKKEVKKAPALRFKGFTNDWEQRKPGDFLVESKIIGHKGDKAKKLTVKLWGKGVQEKQDILSGSANTQYYIRKSGQLMYGKLDFLHAAFGIVPSQLNNYESTIDSPSFDVKSANSIFLLNLFLRKKFYLYYGERANGSRKAKRIHEKDFLVMPIKMPEINEQNKISNLIEIVNNRITLQQRKLTELQLLRTSLNQQLLKDNSSWKSVKLREILNIRNKQIFPNQQYPLMSFVQKQGVVPKSQRYNRDFLVKGNKKYKVTEKGDFIYSSNNLETGSIGINKTGNATISPVYSVFSSKNYKESLFIGLLSEKKSFIYKMIRFRQGVVYGQWKIPEKDFLNIKIKIPNYQEQEKIITLFTHIDNQFKQENKKLTDLQNFKQFLLQNMFI